MLKAELEVSNMEDTEINKNVRTTIGEVNEEISTKEKLRLEIWELNRGLDDAARQADALRMDEAKVDQDPGEGEGPAGEPAAGA